MKPFDNVIVSETEPKNNADVWIQHGDSVKDDIKVNDNGVYNSVFKKSVKICDKTNEEYNINVKAYKYGKIIKVVLYTTNVTKQINQGQQNIVLADLGLENGAIVENTEMITFVYGSDTKNATLTVDGNGLVMLAYIYSNIPTSYQIAQSIIYITK